MSDLKKVAIHTLMPWAKYLTRWSYHYVFTPAQEPDSQVSSSGTSRQCGTSSFLALMVEMGAGKDQQGLKSYLALPLEIKRKIRNSALGTGI